MAAIRRSVPVTVSAATVTVPMAATNNHDSNDPPVAISGIVRDHDNDGDWDDVAAI
jgi:hypothetical protein